MKGKKVMIRTFNGGMLEWTGIVVYEYIHDGSSRVILEREDVKELEHFKVKSIVKILN